MEMKMESVIIGYLDPQKYAEQCPFGLALGVFGYCITMFPTFGVQAL